MAGLPFLERFGSETVRILVGSPAREFILHKKLLMSQSEYFKAAFTENHFSEARSGSLEMKEDDADAFEHLASFLYTNEMPNPLQQAGDDHGMVSIIDFFCLADKVLLPASIKERIMDCPIRTFKLIDWGKFPLSAVPNLMRNTAEDCPFRRLVLDLACLELLEGEDKAMVSKRRRKEHLGLALGECRPFEAVEFVDTVIEHEKNKDIWTQLWKCIGDEKRTVASIERYQTGFLALAKSG